jgi:hypothetical protein
VERACQERTFGDSNGFETLLALDLSEVLPSTPASGLMRSVTVSSLCQSTASGSRHAD